MTNPLDELIEWLEAEADQASLDMNETFSEDAYSRTYGTWHALRHTLAKAVELRDKAGTE